VLEFALPLWVQDKYELRTASGSQFQQQRVPLLVLALRSVEGVREVPEVVLQRYRAFYGKLVPCAPY
jgi:hypothetical protein